MTSASTNLFWNKSQVSSDARARRYGQVGRVVWFTGLSGSGKSTIANEVERKLYQLGRHVYLLDGDNLRHGLCSDLGFSAADRTENIRRAAEVAKLLADAGFICLAAFISPFRADRGELKDFTGVSAPYEVPENPELVIHADRESVEDSVSKVLSALGEDGDASALGI